MCSPLSSSITYPQICLKFYKNIDIVNDNGKEFPE